jgi:hypothetical protein
MPAAIGPPALHHILRYRHHQHPDSTINGNPLRRRGWRSAILQCLSKAFGQRLLRQEENVVVDRCIRPTAGDIGKAHESMGTRTSTLPSSQRALVTVSLGIRARLMRATVCAGMGES